jgi:hypothetical protein
MRSSMLRVLVVIMMVGVICFAQTARAGEPLPLKHGLYVPAGVECAKWEDSDASYTYDGDQLYDINNAFSSIIKVKHKGDTYTFTVKWLSGMGAHNMGTEKWTIVIKNNTSFSKVNDEQETKLSGKRETVFRYCAESRHLR